MKQSEIISTRLSEMDSEVLASYKNKLVFRRGHAFGDLVSVWLCALPEIAQALEDEAHQTCPYSKAIRGNVDVGFNY